MMKLLAFLLLALAGCVSAPEAARPGNGQAATSLHVISHGWHTGVALRQADIAPRRWPEAAHFAPFKYLEVGWGDRDYYMAEGFNAWYALKALFWSTPGVLHLAGFDAAPRRRFPGREIVELSVTRQGLDAFIDHVSASFERQGLGAAPPLGEGQYGASAFYPSREAFHLFKTCNAWTARALRIAGLPIDPSLSAGSIMAQARSLSERSQLP